jgi:hypothetical protein
MCGHAIHKKDCTRCARMQAIFTRAGCANKSTSNRGSPIRPPLVANKSVWLGGGSKRQLEGLEASERSELLAPWVGRRKIPLHEMQCGPKQPVSYRLHAFFVGRRQSYESHAAPEHGLANVSDSIEAGEPERRSHRGRRSGKRVERQAPKKRPFPRLRRTRGTFSASRAHASGTLSLGLPHELAGRRVGLADSFDVAQARGGNRLSHPNSSSCVFDTEAQVRHPSRARIHWHSSLAV